MSRDYDREHRGYARRSTNDGDVERARSQMGEGFYNSGDEYSNTGFGQASYRATPGQSREDRGHYGRGPRGYKRSDERIRDDVCDRLLEHREIDAREVDVHVSDGVVSLDGVVESRRTKRLAEDLAEAVLGVHDVINRLRVEREERDRGA
jgi:osmotically-inducible protein OsmY